MSIMFPRLSVSTAVALALPFVGLSMAVPAQAQGTTAPVDRGTASRSCPNQWSGRLRQCVPNGANSPAIYLKTGASCSKGYGQQGDWCVAGYRPSTNPGMKVSASILTKRDKLDRCPSGYFTGSGSMSCVTNLPNPPAVRMKGTAPCKGDEIDEWGLYCNGGARQLTSAQMRNTFLNDLNVIYGLNKQWPNQQPKGEISPTHRIVHGEVALKDDGTPVSSGRASTSASASASGNAATPADAATSCDKSGRVGAAMGALLGGRKALGAAAAAAICK